MLDRMHSQQIKVGKLDIHYFTGGEGEPLVIIHGSGSGAERWRQNASALCEHYRVYVPDLPGFGYSQPLEGDYGIAEFVDFVEDFTRSLGLEKFNLVGHSLGGGIALHYALKFPHRLGKLVLVNSLCLGNEIALWIRFLSSSVLCRSLGVAATAVLKAVKWLVNLVYAPLKFVNPLPQASIILGGSMATLNEQTAILANRLSELITPTLLVWGANDGIVPVSQAYAAAQVIPNCQLHVFEGCGHSAWRQRIKEFSLLLTTFLC
jgi:pimeloyl-ACP methyl ester carboxylesterase